jgi:hypothetical protein
LNTSANLPAASRGKLLGHVHRIKIAISLFVGIIPLYLFSGSVKLFLSVGPKFA